MKYSVDRETRKTASCPVAMLSGADFIIVLTLAPGRTLFADVPAAQASPRPASAAAAPTDDGALQPRPGETEVEERSTSPPSVPWCPASLTSSIGSGELLASFDTSILTNSQSKQFLKKTLQNGTLSNGGDYVGRSKRRKVQCIRQPKRTSTAT
eukprot:scpid98983/ scgid10650/ 